MPLPGKSALFGLMERTRIGNAVLLSRGYLDDSGWLSSAVEGRPVTRSGRPRPWICLPATRFLEERLPADARIFEWGSGSSTEWWAALGAFVQSCEHDAAWFDKVRSSLPANAEVVLRPVDQGSGDAYVDAVRDGGPWDVVMIDGRRRVECAHAAAKCLTDSGVIVWDDTSRDEYEPGFRFLVEAGFARVDFHGLKPCSRVEHSTSIFYRSGRNVLSL